MPSNKPSKFYEAYEKGLRDGYHHAQQSYQAGPAHDLGELFNGCYQTPRDPEVREFYKQGFKDGQQQFWNGIKRK